MLAHGQLLQHAGFHARGQHVLAAGQRDFHVNEGQCAISLGHVVFAFDDGQQVEHVGVEHVPRTDLLLDHVEPGFFDVHGHAFHVERVMRMRV